MDNNNYYELCASVSRVKLKVYYLSNFIGQEIVFMISFGSSTEDTTMCRSNSLSAGLDSHSALFRSYEIDMGHQNPPDPHRVALKSPQLCVSNSIFV